MDRVIATILVLFCAFLAQYLWTLYRTPSADSVLEGIEVDEELLKHSKEFDDPVVYKISDNVHVAVGFALANSILLIAPTGVIIVDTTEGVQAAREIYEEFRKITDKPLKAIIYTHNHPDHIMGTEGFLDDPENPPDIWAHHTMPVAMESWIRGSQRVYYGTQHQFGTELGKELVNAGIGPRLRVKVTGADRKYMPNRFLYKDQEDIVIAGLKLRLIHIPGETPDQIGVWLPDSKIMIPADDVYRAFPNLYAIRGTPPRNILDWSTSVKKMRDLHPHVLVPCHSRPIFGREQVHEILTGYKDAIQFVHDQSLRYINQGYHPTEVAQKVRLPENLAMNPYLREFYGTVEWSARAVYDMYFGWFSGDPLDLAPLSHKEKAERMVALVGWYGMLSAAQTALAQRDYQWALELSSYVFLLDPKSTKARELRLQALRHLAAKQRSAPGRNFYSTVALHDHKLIHTKLDLKSNALTIPLHYLFEAMKTRLKAEVVEGLTFVTVMNFTDVEKIFTLRIHNCVLDVETVAAEKFDLKLSTEEIVWREIVAGLRSPIIAYTKGDIVVQGSLWTLRDFQGYFERPE